MKIHNPYIIFLTGASGAGKTSLLNSISHDFPSVKCFHFDSVGVPSEEEMIRQYGSPSERQKAMTFYWVNKLTKEHVEKKLIIIEGQVNLAFIASAFEQVKFPQYKIILVHCDDTTRHERLHTHRNQSELINENMDNWANYLRKQAIDMNVTILDTTSMSIKDMSDWFKKELENITKGK